MSVPEHRLDYEALKNQKVCEDPGLVSRAARLPLGGKHEIRTWTPWRFSASSRSTPRRNLEDQCGLYDPYGIND
eukprot:14143813-Heterocapsa_arctica.AAC.1